MKSLFRLLRVVEYPKNLVVLAPLFFSGFCGNWGQLQSALLCTLAFCCLASSAYIFNDWMDVDFDRLNPNRRARVLATGTMIRPQAFFLMFVLLIIGFSIAYSINWNVLFIAVIYIVTIMLYSVKLKHISIVDISLVSIGFVLRLYAGAASTHLTLSPFIIMLSFMLALFLVLGKRHDEYLYCVEMNLPLRPALEGYSERLFDVAVSIIMTVMVTGYMLYTIVGNSPSQRHFPELYMTTFFVIAGAMRYLQQIYVNKESADPYRMLAVDRIQQLIIVCWLSCFVWALYL